MSAIQKRLSKMEVRFDEDEFVVIDIGTGFIKAGYSGEDLPRVVIPTVLGVKNIAIDEGGNNTEVKTKTSYKVGNAAFSARDDHELYFPIERGVVKDWDHMTVLLQHVFDNELGADTRNMNLLIADSPLTRKEDKQQLATIMFENFKVKSFALMNTAVLSLFSTGTTTGLVAESGEGVTYTVPVFEGYALPHALHSLNVSGADITNKLIKELQNCDSPVSEKQFEYIRDIKEQMCHVSLDFDQEMLRREDPLTQEQRSYELPSGEIIEVNCQKRITASEAIFRPQIVDQVHPEFRECHGGIAYLAYKSIEKCDTDLKINLYNNIVLAGGTTLLKNFRDRFDYEVREFAHNEAKTDINVNAALHRKNAAWVGGSMLSSLSTFSEMTIKNQEYMETQPETERTQSILKKTIY